MKEEFPDWHSPMVVKEVLQTLRNRLFAVPFMCFHALLALVTIAGISQAGPAGQKIATAFFWLLAGFLFLAFIPGSGLNAIPSEARGNTLELLFMCRLTAWRIVVGKWMGMAGQALIVFFSMIPYAVLRYFLGNVAILDDMRNLIVMLGASLVLSALTIALSAYLSLWMRILAVIGGLFVLQSWGIFYLQMHLVGSVPTARNPWIDLIAWVIGGGLFLVLCLVFAASKIAPPAENHAWSKRALGLALTLGVAVAIRSGVDTDIGFIIIPSLLAILLVCADAAMDPIKRLPVLYLPFGRRNWMGRTASWIASPGWVTGLMFSTLVIAVLWFARKPWISDYPARESLPFLATAGALTIPLAIYRSFLPHVRQPFAIFVAFHAISGVVAVLVAVFSRGSREAIDAFSFIPLCALVVAINGSENFSAAAALSGVAVGVSLIVIGVCFVREAPQVAALQRAALQLQPPRLLDED